MKLSDKATAVFEETRQRLLSGDLGPFVDFAKLTVKGYDKPMSKWSALNQLIAYFTTGSVDCRGYKQWQEVGRWVKPASEGGRATYIRVHCVVKPKDDDQEEEEKVFYKWVSVFPDYATDGDPLPEPEELDVNQLPDLYEVCRKLGIQVKYADIPGAWGCVDRDATLIELKTKHPSVFYHELAHAIRLKEGWYDQDDYDGEEAIADVIACVFSKLFDNEDTTFSTHRYVSHYLGSIDMMVGFLSEMAKTIEKLLDFGEIADEEA